MGQQSKRTRAPVPRLVPAVLPHLVQPPPPHLVQPPPHLLVQPPPHLVQPPMPPHEPESGGSIPPRPPKAAAASVSSWSPQMQAPLWYTNLDDLNPETWGVDSHPPGGFLGFFKDASNVNSSQQIKEKDDSNGVECARTEKRLLWTKDEDLRLEANALYASGEPDTDLKKRAMQTYEADHKEDGPFMFEHCWEVLKDQPKWDAYLERLEDVEPDKRKFSVDDEVGQHFTLDDDKEQRPPGGKTAKDQRKRKTKDEGCIIDLEDELSRFVDAQKAANEGRKEMLETQRRVSSENLEARKLACLAAKDHKESVMLETYRSLMMQDTTRMSEDVRSEHVLALKCFREKLFGKTD
ncbi:hypothetical protein D1007_11404 [Hordeum vulgare]|nr:hypothetical protein D1007_11404 [Hordeum vulgare]